MRASPLDMVRPTLPAGATPPPPGSGLEGLCCDCRTSFVLESRQIFFVIFFIRFHLSGLSPMIGGGLGRKLAETFREDLGDCTTSLDEEKGKWSLVGACFAHVGSSNASFLDSVFLYTKLRNGFLFGEVLFDFKCLDVVKDCGFNQSSRQHPYWKERSQREWIRTSLRRRKPSAVEPRKDNSLVTGPLRLKLSTLKRGNAATRELAGFNLTARSAGFKAAKFLVLSRANRALLVHRMSGRARHNRMEREESGRRLFVGRCGSNSHLSNLQTRSLIQHKPHHVHALSGVDTANSVLDVRWLFARSIEETCKSLNSPTLLQ